MNVDPAHASSAGVERQPAEKSCRSFLRLLPLWEILRFEGKSFSFATTVK
jgi:hypothetical protein